VVDVKARHLLTCRATPGHSAQVKSHVVLTRINGVLPRLHSVTAESNRPWNTLLTCVRSQNCMAACWSSTKQMMMPSAGWSGQRRRSSRNEMNDFVQLDLHHWLILYNFSAYSSHTFIVRNSCAPVVFVWQVYDVKILCCSCTRQVMLLLHCTTECSATGMPLPVRWRPSVKVCCVCQPSLSRRARGVGSCLWRFTGTRRTPARCFLEEYLGTSLRVCMKWVLNLLLRETLN